MLVPGSSSMLELLLDRADAVLEILDWYLRARDFKLLFSLYLDSFNKMMSYFS
jgi:hypothetical protein